MTRAKRIRPGVIEPSRSLEPRELDIGGIYNLLAAVWEQAIRDARKGDKHAIHFLEQTFPEWREVEKRYKRIEQNYQEEQTRVPRDRISVQRRRAGRANQRQVHVAG